MITKSKRETKKTKTRIVDVHADNRTVDLVNKSSDCNRYNIYCSTFVHKKTKSNEYTSPQASSF
jgi:hypothetical protein